MSFEIKSCLIDFSILVHSPMDVLSFCAGLLWVSLLYRETSVIQYRVSLHWPTRLVMCWTFSTSRMNSKASQWRKVMCEQMTFFKSLRLYMTTSFSIKLLNLNGWTPPSNFGSGYESVTTPLTWSAMKVTPNFSQKPKSVEVVTFFQTKPLHSFVSLQRMIPGGKIPPCIYMLLSVILFIETRGCVTHGAIG